MSGNKILIDTNIVIEIFGGNKQFANQIRRLSEFYIPSVVIGELYVGVNRVTNKLKHLRMLNRFVGLGIVLSIDEGTAKHYGEIVASLYKKGRPIPTNDIWIAALAKQHNFTLVSSNKHFKEIEKLKSVSW